MPATSVDPLSAPISVDALMRLKRSIEGRTVPSAFEALRPYLAGQDGVITYRVSGQTGIDQAGRQKKRLKCIISGWFLLCGADGRTPVAFPVEIESKLVLVGSEQELPPLEEEAEDEDTIVCGTHIDLKAQLQEELLLALPTDVLRAVPAVGEQAAAVLPVAQAAITAPAVAQPFAKLAALKKRDADG